MDETTLFKLSEQYLIPSWTGSFKNSFSNTIIDRANGSRIFDLKGKPYLDFNSGQMGAALGHNHPLLIKAINRASDKILHCAKHLLHPPQVLLAKALAEIVDRPLVKSMFMLSGTDATSAALIMAALSTEGNEFGAMDIAYHGSLGIARSLSFMGIGSNPLSYDKCHPLPAPYCYRCPMGTCYPTCGLSCLEEGLRQLKSIPNGRLAAVIVEPVMSAGGVVEAPHDYLKGLAAEVRDLGGMFILDESQTGLGKLGTMFGYQQHDVVPDILTLGKHFGAGVPVSAVITTEEVLSRCLSRNFMVVGSHFSDPLACTAGLASLEIIKQEDLISKAQVNGVFVATLLKGLMEKYEIIGDIRGKGGLFGVELVQDRKNKLPATKEASFIYKRCHENGLVIGIRGANNRQNVLRLVPPLICDQDSLKEGLDILDQALNDLDL
jgi:2,2-dialkylglycine decarboxylase (pyruvate)